MAVEAKELKQAQLAFETLRQMLKEQDWHFEEDTEKLLISCGAQGEDLPIKIIIKVDAERQIISLISHLPFSIPEEKRVEIAVAVSAVNYALADGSFDYNFVDGTLLFRMTSSFRESLLGKDVFEYMLFVACKTIDDYNDKFLFIIKDKMSLEDLLNFINE